MKIFTSENKARLDQIESFLSPGKNLATATETVLDKEFIEKYKDDWCWVGHDNTPLETRWYKVDRENKCLVKISDEDVLTLQWHERVFIYGSALSAAKEGSHLALYIGGEYDDGRLTALYLCGPDYLAWVAQK